MRGNKGFTLVEMAIVLVIIGVILGAVIKGQDLITNAQTKQIASGVSSWRNLVYAYFDRNGRFPGDASRNGIIGDSTASTPSEQADTGSSISEIVTTMNYAPTNPITAGGLSFWVYFGNSSPTVGTRNCIVICKDAACATTFSTDELEVIKSLDAAYDGVADAGLGQFRGLTTAPTITAALTGAGTPARDNRVVTAIAAASFSNASTNGSTTAWGATHLAAVWLFDRTF